MSAGVAWTTPMQAARMGCVGKEGGMRAGRFRALAMVVALFGGLAACGGADAPGYVPGLPSQFGDTDPHPWPRAQAPTDHEIHGVDVSKFQGAIDWPRAAGAGVSFAFIKATEGGDRLDPLFKENWRAARRAGIPRGAYHFYYFCRPAADQAKWFIRNVPAERGALPPVLDMEWNHLSPTCKMRPDPEKVRSEATIFLRALTRHYGQRPVIYTTVDFWDRNQMEAERL